MLTGKFQTRFGYEFNPVGHHNADPRVGIPRSEITIAELLRDSGYATAIVGKWHIGASAGANPLRHGFDEFFGFLHEGHYFVPPPYDGVTTMLRRRVLPTGANKGRWVSDDRKLILSAHMGHNEPAYDADNAIIRNGQPVTETEYLTDAFGREAVRFIDQNKQRPFFLYVAYNAVHSPLQSRDEDLEQFSHIEDVHRRVFAGMLSRLDRSIGQVLAKLKSEDLTENTIVFFISDNGGPTKELTSSNAPLRGGKGTLYEGGIRVPFLMQWPGRIDGDRSYSEPVSSVDVMGTAAAIAGAKAPRGIDGVNLIPFVTGNDDSAPHEMLFWRQGKQTAIRHRNWKLVRPRSRRRDADWELYELRADESETRNVANANPGVLKDLTARWAQLNGQMVEPLWSPSIR